MGSRGTFVQVLRIDAVERRRASYYMGTPEGGGGGGGGGPGGGGGGGGLSAKCINLNCM